MFRNRGLFFSSLIFLATIAPNVEAVLSPKAQRAQDVMEGFGAISEQALIDFNVPGVGIGIVVDGQVVFAKGYGVRDVESREPMTADTVFEIGSCTKPFTTFLMGMLSDEGLLNWDDAIIDILPDFRMWDAYATQNLTLRDLLTHRSGMPRHDFMWYNSGLSRQEIFHKLRYLEPTCDFRERYNYNNLMYLTAGLAMEKVTGKSWEELIAEKILLPLEMSNTYFHVDDMQKSSDFAIPYVERMEKLRKMPFRDVSNMGPAASICSSVNDLNHWLKLLLAQGTYNGHTLLSPTTLLEIEAPQVIISGYAENKDAQLNAYGLGWKILSYRGHYFVSHDGGINGFTSVAGIFPQDGIGIVVLVNKNQSSLPRYLSLVAIDRILELPAREWLKEGMEQFLKSRKVAADNLLKEDLNRKKGTMPSHSIEEYAGRYTHPGYGMVTVEYKNGRLQALHNKIISYLNHWHYDVFSIVEESEDLIIPREGTKFSFRNNVKGEISELSIPFEPGVPDIIFKKQPDGQFTDLDYFRQFIGKYELYNVVAEVMIRDRTLVAVIPGEPLFELLPVTENEFTVKSMTSYSVKFVKAPDGSVEEVLLILPYGAFSAKPVQ
jgi:CubicO group peptidase (beta-lactamase class C family)